MGSLLFLLMFSPLCCGANPGSISLDKLHGIMDLFHECTILISSDTEFANLYVAHQPYIYYQDHVKVYRHYYLHPLFPRSSLLQLELGSRLPYMPNMTALPRPQNCKLQIRLDLDLPTSAFGLSVFEAFLFSQYESTLNYVMWLFRSTSRAQIKARFSRVTNVMHALLAPDVNYAHVLQLEEVGPKRNSKQSMELVNVIGEFAVESWLCPCVYCAKLILRECMPEWKGVSEGNYGTIQLLRQLFKTQHEQSVHTAVSGMLSHAMVFNHIQVKHGRKVTLVKYGTRQSLTERGNGGSLGALVSLIWAQLGNKSLGDVDVRNRGLYPPVADYMTTDTSIGTRSHRNPDQTAIHLINFVPVSNEAVTFVTCHNVRLELSLKALTQPFDVYTWLFVISSAVVIGCAIQMAAVHGQSVQSRIRLFIFPFRTLIENLDDLPMNLLQSKVCSSIISVTLATVGVVLSNAYKGRMTADLAAPGALIGPDTFVELLKEPGFTLLVEPVYQTFSNAYPGKCLNFTCDIRPLRSSPVAAHVNHECGKIYRSKQSNSTERSDVEICHKFHKTIKYRRNKSVVAKMTSTCEKTALVQFRKDVGHFRLEWERVRSLRNRPFMVSKENRLETTLGWNFARMNESKLRAFCLKLLDAGIYNYFDQRMRELSRSRDDWINVYHEQRRQSVPLSIQSNLIASVFLIFGSLAGLSIVVFEAEVFKFFCCHCYCFSFLVSEDVLDTEPKIMHVQCQSTQ